MGAHTEQPVEVFRLRPAIFWPTAFAALLLQAVLPLKIPVARLLDLPLLVTIYFSLLRRNKIFGVVLGTGLGLTQDALSAGLIGMAGMSKALVGYLAAWASVKFELDNLVARFVMAGVFVLVHHAFLLGLERGLLEAPPPFHPLDLASGVLFNVGLALVLFQVLDRFRKSA